MYSYGERWVFDGKGSNNSLDIQIFSLMTKANPYHLKLGVGYVNRHKLHKLGKALIQPQVIPPLHCHQVAKPLQGH